MKKWLVGAVLIGIFGAAMLAKPAEPPTPPKKMDPFQLRAREVGPRVTTITFMEEGGSITWTQPEK